MCKNISEQRFPVVDVPLDITQMALVYILCDVSLMLSYSHQRRHHNPLIMIKHIHLHIWLKMNKE